MTDYITPERFEVAQKELRQLYEEKRPLPIVYFNQQKLQLLSFWQNPSEDGRHVWIFATAPESPLVFQSPLHDRPIGYTEHDLTMPQDYSVLDWILSAISYALRGPDLDLVWIIEQYENINAVSLEGENWLDQIQDKEKVAKVRDILAHRDLYSIGNVSDRIIKSATGRVVRKHGTITDVIRAHGVTFGYFQSHVGAPKRLAKLADDDGCWYITIE